MLRGVSIKSRVVPGQNSGSSVTATKNGLIHVVEFST